MREKIELHDPPTNPLICPKCNTRQPNPGALRIHYAIRHYTHIPPHTLPRGTKEITPFGPTCPHRVRRIVERLEAANDE